MRELRPDAAEGLEALERLFGRAAGCSMRELLGETPGADGSECNAT
jgi:hypothetical protein